MSTHRNCNGCGSMPYFVPYGARTLVISVSRLVLESVEPTGPKVHLAPNHQDYTPNHRNNGRSKFKRPGR